MGFYLAYLIWSLTGESRRYDTIIIFAGEEVQRVYYTFKKLFGRFSTTWKKCTVLCRQPFFLRHQKNWSFNIFWSACRRTMIFSCEWSLESVDTFPYPCYVFSTSQKFFRVIQSQTMPQKWPFSSFLEDIELPINIHQGLSKHNNYHLLTFGSVEYDWDVVWVSHLLWKIDMIPNKFAKALVGAWKLTENFFMGLKCRYDIHQNTIFGAILDP